MAYCFVKSDRTIEMGVRRIALEQIDAALEAAGPDAARDDRIHRLRKGCKKLRGLIRMVRPVFDGYAVENAAIRDAAAGLSGARDAEVMIATLDMLAIDAGDPDAFAAFRRGLMAEQGAGTEQGDGAALTAFRDHMQAVRERAGDWRLDADGFDALAEGIGAAVAGARKAMRRARADPAPETVHDWRKRVKDHWYHARLLAPLWPVPMDAHARAADRLGELLGQHHDLAVLTARARAEPGPLGDRAAGRKLLRRLVAERQAALEANCFAIGARLLAEPPDALVHRWRAYWKVWRKEEDARVV